jgi:hypothetical protein
LTVYEPLLVLLDAHLDFAESDILLRVSSENFLPVLEAAVRRPSGVDMRFRIISEIDSLLALERSDIFALVSNE